MSASYTQCRMSLQEIDTKGCGWPLLERSGQHFNGSVSQKALEKRTKLAGMAVTVVGSPTIIRNFGGMRRQRLT
jgi:hypothetical protein